MILDSVKEEEEICLITHNNLKNEPLEILPSQNQHNIVKVFSNKNNIIEKNYTDIGLKCLDTGDVPANAVEDEAASETAVEDEAASETAVEDEAASETAVEDEAASETAVEDEVATETAVEEDEAASETAVEEDEAASETAVEEDEAASETAVEEDDAASETAVEEDEAASETAVEEDEVGIKKPDSNLIPDPRKYLESSSNNSHGVATNNTFEDLCEVNITLPDTTETIQLRKPNEVYYEIYRAALKKAKHMRNVALNAFLEAKNIKERYMLIEIDEDSDNEEIENQDDLG
jgi:hypothetical protein